MADSAGYNTQSDPGEDVGVVSLPGEEGASVGQDHLVERTPAGKDASALIKEEGIFRFKLQKVFFFN